MLLLWLSSSYSVYIYIYIYSYSHDNIRVEKNKTSLRRVNEYNNNIGFRKIQTRGEHNVRHDNDDDRITTRTEFISLRYSDRARVHIVRVNLVRRHAFGLRRPRARAELCTVFCAAITITINI